MFHLKSPYPLDRAHLPNRQQRMFQNINRLRLWDNRLKVHWSNNNDSVTLSMVLCRQLLQHVSVSTNFVLSSSRFDHFSITCIGSDILSWPTATTCFWCHVFRGDVSTLSASNQLYVGIIKLMQFAFYSNKDLYTQIIIF